MKKKATPPPVTYSPRQLLSYWFFWMLGNAASIYLNLYLRSNLILIIWSILIIFGLGYLLLNLKQQEKRIQQLWQLLFVIGFITSILEGVFAIWFIEDCYLNGTHCYGLDFSDLRGSWWW